MLNITSMFCSFATCKSRIVNWFRTELNYIFGNISYCNCIYFHLDRCKPFFGIQIKKWFLDFHIASNFVLWQHLFYFLLIVTFLSFLADASEFPLAREFFLYKFGFSCLVTTRPRGYLWGHFLFRKKYIIFPTADGSH